MNSQPQEFSELWIQLAIVLTLIVVVGLQIYFDKQNPSR
jgi:hypothetical protein